jgi:membrane associated rhomboid family serine protease
MSIYNRDYMRDDRRPRGNFTGPSSWTVVGWLMAINIGAYALQMFLTKGEDLLGLSFGSLQLGRWWTPLTYQFAHANLWHLLGNMLGLFFLGRMLYDLVRSRAFLQIYLGGAFLGGACQLLYSSFSGSDGTIIGASGAVMAIIAALATLVPHQSIQLLVFFVLPVKLTMRHLALLSILVNFVTLAFELMSPSASSQGTAVFAHFGGMIFGWFHVRFLYRGLLPQSRTRREGKSFFGIRILRDEDGTNAATQPKPKAKKKTPFVAQDVDAILDKINAEGFQSLTDEERQILERGSQRLAKRIDRDKKR